MSKCLNNYFVSRMTVVSRKKNEEKKKTVSLKEYFNKSDQKSARKFGILICSTFSCLQISGQDEQIQKGNER